MRSEIALQDILARARLGDEEAAARLVREYGPELQRYVHFRFTHPGARRFLDSLDVCQSVLAAFFVRLQGGNLDTVGPRQVFRLLMVMAENKVRDKVRRHQATRRGDGAEMVPVETAAHIVDRGPDPAEDVANRELVRAIRDRLLEDDRTVVDRWMAGDGWPEIAAVVGGTPEGVRKRFTRSIDRAARELGLLGDES